jgi:hypothetical protein
MLASTARESYAMGPVEHSTRSQRRTAVASAILLAVSAGAAAGCFTDKRPTQVMVTPVAAAIKPAKPPDCDMPVLTQAPTVAYQQVAIVEAWADVDEDPANVLPQLKRQACATGAEALLIVSGRKQDVKSMLYGVTPNESETAVTSANRTPNQTADYVNKMQYKPKVGEAGHTGYYIDALAIDYGTAVDPASAEGQPPPKP